VDRGRDAAREAAAAPGDHDRSRRREVFEDLEADGAVARHHVEIVERVDERAVHAGVAAGLERLPPALEGHLDHAAAQALDGGDLGGGRRVGRHHRARDPAGARAPGDALRHVAG
jgi:hypothetical protein